MGTNPKNLDKDFISLINGNGAIKKAYTHTIWGINQYKTGTLAPSNKDTNGLTFFTRPRLNLDTDNIKNVRTLTPLLSRHDKSLGRIIRCTLDPTLAIRDQEEIGNAITSPLVDPYQPFIPLLSNNLISLSGWPDIVADVYQTKAGIYKETQSMIDSTTHIFTNFPLTASFRNLQGDPITLLFSIWVQYASLVYDGTLLPYPEAIEENEIDYNTRIYRLILDYTGQYVQKIGACGAAFPTVSPLGAVFDFELETPFSNKGDQVSIEFKANGATYMDPILIREFNDLVDHFPYMDHLVTNENTTPKSPVHRSKENKIEKVPFEEIMIRNYLNSRLYPKINPLTLELEWWAFKEDIREAGIMINSFLESGGWDPNLVGDNSPWNALDREFLPSEEQQPAIQQNRLR